MNGLFESVLYDTPVHYARHDNGDTTCYAMDQLIEYEVDKAAQ